VSTGALLGPGRLAEEVDTVQWVTREHPKTDRIACPWLIRRFIDPHAEILYVPADQVLAIADRQQAISFDAPGARYTHRDGLCSFEVLVADYRIDDPAVALLAAQALRGHGAAVPALLVQPTARRSGSRSVFTRAVREPAGSFRYGTTTGVAARRLLHRWT